MAQGKENLPECETITILDSDELKRFKEDVYAAYSNGVRKHQQAAAYILMLNTGLRSGEALGLKNSDIDLDNKQLHIQNSVKEVYNRDGVKATGGKTTKVGKTKPKTSKRTVPLNNAAIEAIKELRKEYYFSEDSLLICDEHGNYTKPVNFRKKVLQNTQRCRNRNKRSAFPKAYIRNKLDKRRKTTRRNNTSLESETSGRLTRTHDITDNRNVLCEKGYIKIKRSHGWIRDIENGKLKIGKSPGDFPTIILNFTLSIFHLRSID